MNIFERLSIGGRRWKNAREIGKSFYGTSRPFSLNDVRIAGALRTISTPTNSGHWHDFVNVILDDEYGLRKMSSVPSSIIDLGGNVGMFSLWARNCFPEAEIHCYEPNQDLWPFLSLNLEGLGVKIFQSAVANRRGRGKVLDTEDNRCCRLALAEDGVVVVDSFFDVIDRMNREVDLLKIDIEGGEWDLFLLENQNCLRKIKRIVMEYHEVNSQKLADLLKLVKLHGFSVDHVFSNQGFGVLWMHRKAIGPPKFF